MKAKPAPLVTQYGTMWPRNRENIRLVRKVARNGVYILFDGSMPMYIGKGELGTRIKRAADSDRRGDRWNCFSWYEIRKAKYIHDVEVLILKMFPPNFRPLNRQDGNFTRVGAKLAPDKKNPHADLISRKIQKKEKRKVRTRDAK